MTAAWSLHRKFKTLISRRPLSSVHANKPWRWPFLWLLRTFYQSQFTKKNDTIRTWFINWATFLYKYLQIKAQYKRPTYKRHYNLNLYFLPRGESCRAGTNVRTFANCRWTKIRYTNLHFKIKCLKTELILLINNLILKYTNTTPTIGHKRDDSIHKSMQCLFFGMVNLTKNKHRLLNASNNSLTMKNNWGHRRNS